MKKPPLAPKRRNRIAASSLNLSTIDDVLETSETKGFSAWVKTHWIKGATIVFVFLLGLGVMAKNGWLPRTDSLSGKKTGWFGREIPKNVSSTWNPFATAFATPTPPQLSKEYVYAGSRLLTVEDARANAVPPHDLALWRPSTGEWRIFRGDAELEPVTWGQEGDVPIQGDYDGDGKTDFAVFRPSSGYTYIVRSSDNSDYSVAAGTAGDIPVPADFDGDNKTDIVFRKDSDKKWTIKLSTTSEEIESTYGSSGGDVPIAADFDGDGFADKAYWKSSNHTFYFHGSLDNTEHTQSLGVSSDIPLCADYDGDGKTDFAVKRGERWIIHSSIDGSDSGIIWQNADDIPVPNDYDGDGKVDIAVYHEAESDGIWYIRQSSDLSTRVEKFGLPGDIPVPGNYRR